MSVQWIGFLITNLRMANLRGASRYPGDASVDGWRVVNGRMEMAA